MGCSSSRSILLPSVVNVVSGLRVVVVGVVAVFGVRDTLASTGFDSDANDDDEPSGEKKLLNAENLVVSELGGWSNSPLTNANDSGKLGGWGGVGALGGLGGRGARGGKGATGSRFRGLNEDLSGCQISDDAFVSGESGGSNGRPESKLNGLNDSCDATMLILVAIYILSAIEIIGVEIIALLTCIIR